MKKYKFINGIKHKAIGFNYNGKPIGWIACENKQNEKVLKSAFSFG